MDSLQQSGEEASSDGGKPPTDGEQRKSAERKLWRAYSRNPTAENRNAIVHHHWGLIYQVAIRFNNQANQSGRFDFSEILSEASITAIRCVESFDYRRGFQFTTYFWNAFFRNAMRVMIRGGKRRETIKKTTIVALGDRESHIEAKPIRDQETIGDETGVELDELLSTLSDQQRAVIHARFFRGMTLHEIGKEIGLTKERVRQIELQALRALRDKLGIPKGSVVE